MAIRTGTARSETLHGTMQADTLQGLGGNDELIGYGGRDNLYGGDGSDRLDGSSGQDFLYGGLGNDTLRSGGTVLDYDVMYGESGNDLFVIDQRARVTATEFSTASSSAVFGGAGIDTLRIVNNAVGADGRPAVTEVSFGVPGGGSDWFQAAYVANGQYENLAYGYGIERLEFTGPGFARLFAHADLHATGTAQADRFEGYTGNQTFLGGGGNDRFFIGDGGTDRVVSYVNDADTIRVLTGYNGSLTISGFGGAGRAGGDRLTIEGGADSIRTAGGTTIFDIGDGVITVDAVGLLEGTDYGFV